MDDVNFYELLGITHDCDSATVKSAYRALLKQVHPDTGGNAGMFRMIQTAYETLSDEDRRAAYDAQLGSSSTGTRTGANRSGGGNTDPEPVAAEPASRVDVGRLTWVGQALRAPGVDNGGETITPADRTWLAPLPLLLRGLVVTLAAVVVYLTLTGGLAEAAQGVGVVVLVGVTATVWHRLWAWSAPVLLAAVFALGLGPGQHGGAGVLWWVWFATVCAAAAAEGARHLFYDPFMEKVLPVRSVREFTLFGQPGSAAAGAGAETQMAARIGADAIAVLTTIPGVRVLHRVFGPDTGTVQAADQVVVCGKKVALVVCRAGVAGTYGWSGFTGSLTLNGRHLPSGAVLDDVPTDQFRTLLPGCEIRTWVLIASPTDSLTVDNTGAPDGVRAGAPHDVVEDIGTWLLDAHCAVVDRRVLATLARGIR